MTNDRNVEEEGEGTKICKSCVWINLFLSTQITNHQINKDSLGLNLGHVKRSTKMTDNLSWDMPETEFVDSVQLILTAAPQWRGNLPCANSLFIFPQLAREQSDKYSFLIPIFIWSHLFSWWKSLMPPAKKATTNGQHYGLWAREKGLKETQESKKRNVLVWGVRCSLCQSCRSKRSIDIRIFFSRVVFKFDADKKRLRSGINTRHKIENRCMSRRAVSLWCNGIEKMH